MNAPVSAAVFTLLFCTTGFAQNAKNPPIALSQWTTEQDYTESHLSGKWHGEMRKVVTGLASWIQEAYPDPRECTPAWSGAYFSGKTNTLPFSNATTFLKYEMRAGFYTGDRASAGPEKQNRFVIAINDLSLLQQSLICYQTSYSLFTPMKEIYSGIFYQENAGPIEDRPAGWVTRTWLITYAGRLPYTCISRREYLEEAKKEITTDIERVKEHLKQLIPVRPAAEQEAAQKRDLQEIENMYSGVVRANRQRIYLESYRPDSVYFNEALSSRTAPLDSAYSLMDSLLSKASPDWLGRPAFISRPALYFRGFEDNRPGSSMLVKWDPGYFSRTVSPAKPQFLLVTWQYDPGDPIAVSVDKELMDNLDLCDLTSLLDR